MADYQKEISGDLENLKFKQQKNFKDFELFTSKKHEKYPEMYTHWETTYGFIFSVQMKIEQGLSILVEELNKEDLNSYFDYLKLSSSEKEKLLEKLEVDKQSAIDEIRKIDKDVQYALASEKWTEANNYYINNLLYFSDDVSKACSVIRDNLLEYLRLLRLNDLRGTELNDLQSFESNYKQQMFEEILPNNRISLRTEMQKELRIGNT
ncbi:hypothetical protein Q5O89_15720 [Peribacillus frigoritolerans]|nr:hypothetical protein [Peribacillus frigoritolerans]